MDGSPKLHIYRAVAETVEVVVQQQQSKEHAVYIYPHDLLGWLPFRCSEWTVRRYCREMAEKSLIIPLTGSRLVKLERKSRKGGYTVVAA
jgi:hypothetical protein